MDKTDTHDIPIKIVIFYWVTKIIPVYLFLHAQKIPNRGIPQSNNEFLSKCSIGIGDQYEVLNDNSWVIISNKNDNIESNENNSENDDHSFSKILAYNNNTLDKMILAHAYQQQFGEVDTFF